MRALTESCIGTPYIEYLDHDGRRLHGALLMLLGKVADLSFTFVCSTTKIVS